MTNLVIKKLRSKKSDYEIVILGLNMIVLMLHDNALITCMKLAIIELYLLISNKNGMNILKRV